MSVLFTPASKPTMYFIGVTTRQSSINRVFPQWARQLGLGDCELCGLDFPLNAEPRRFREAVDFIKRDPLSRGALVTSHKVAVFAACADLFDAIEPVSRSLGEVSSLYKRDGQLHGRSVDPWTCGYALEAFLPRDHWRSGAAVLILGAGGSGAALLWHLNHAKKGHTCPAQVHLADRSLERLKHARELHANWTDAARLAVHHVPQPELADAVLARLPPGSLVVNATGAGKDTPGSPLTATARFPERGLIWDFNYRGELLFLQQARAQRDARSLQIEDGWRYFLHGWTSIIADVFDCEIPSQGPLFDELARIAAHVR